MPEKINPPPDDWRPVFNRLAEECSITASIEEAYTALENVVASLKKDWYGAGF